MSTNKDTTTQETPPQPLDAALEAKEGVKISRELGGIEWEINLPLPGFLFMKLLGTFDDTQERFKNSIDLIYAAIGDEQRDAFDKRMMEKPFVVFSEVDEFVGWLISKATSRPTDPQ